MSVFGTIVKDGKIIIDDAVKVFKTVEHDAVVLAALAVHLFGAGPVKQALDYAAQAAELYVKDKFPALEQVALDTLKHEFVKSQLLQNSGIASSLVNFLAAQANHLFGVGGTNIIGLIQGGVSALETQSGAAA